jgi:signal recognition particle receptor subunit beta
MANYKLIFTGPVGAGKTTAIITLSDTAPVSTDASATDMTATRKAQTTVAMDYGMMKISETERIHLYGTPGQERFEFMWQILSEGGLGLVLMLDNSRTTSFQDMHFFLDAFKSFINGSKVVIGITHMDTHPTPAINDYHAQLQGTGLNPPIFEVDARNRDDMVTLVKSLLYSIDPGLEENV